MNMLAHVFSVLGMGSRVVRHETLLEHGARALRRRRPRRRRTRARRPARARPPQDRGLPPGDRRPARVGQAVPRGVPGPPGALRPARDSPCLQGHRLPGHPVVGAASTGARSGSASTTPSSAGSATDDLPDGVTVETDPATGDIHLVAGPNFRGVQFHAESILTENGFALLRRPAAGAAGVTTSRGCSWSTTTTPTPGTSCTWSPRSPASCRRSSSTTRPACSTVAGRCHPRRAVTRTRSPGRRRPTSRSAPTVFDARRAGARRVPRHAGPRHVVRRDGGRGSSRPTARWRRSTTTGSACSPGSRRRSRRCATTRSPRPRCPTSSR